MSRFAVTVPGKWVLAGEHAVLRGATAVALPHPTLSLRLDFEPGGDSLRIEPASADRIVRELVAISGLKATPVGTLRLSSTLPTGSGLGSSAALCVAVTRWLASPLGLAQADLLPFARKLEDKFHGQSSGMDVAVALAAEPIEFSMKDGARPLGATRLPRFTFHDTGLRASTRDCVEHVRARADAATDARMTEAAREAARAIRDYAGGEDSASLKRLAHAMSEAQDCFRAWGLLPPEAERIEREQKARGALACKITGAGRGGYIVALWPS